MVVYLVQTPDGVVGVSCRQEVSLPPSPPQMTGVLAKVFMVWCHMPRGREGKLHVFPVEGKNTSVELSPELRDSFPPAINIAEHEMIITTKWPLQINVIQN